MSQILNMYTFLAFIAGVFLSTVVKSLASSVKSRTVG